MTTRRGSALIMAIIVSVVVTALVMVIATSANAQSQVHMTVVTNAPIPVLATSGTITLVSASTQITGTVTAVGNISFTGNGTITGDLLSQGTIGQGLINVSGAVVSHDATAAAPPDPATIYNNLQPTAWTYSGSLSNRALDFTAHPIIYLNGNVTLGATVPIGSGTIVVNGTVSIGSNPWPSDGSTANINIVANNTVTTGGTTRQKGSIYTSGTFTETGTHYITGVIDANKVTVNGQTHYTAGPAPSFDPRASGTGSGTVSVSSYGDSTP